jgi:hypothetical protein
LDEGGSLQELLDAILDSGRRYRDEHLHPFWSPIVLGSDWREAFTFFLGRACYQGRADNVSQKVFDAAKAALEATIYVTDCWSDADLADVRLKVGAVVGGEMGKAGKGRDVDMIM